MNKINEIKEIIKRFCEINKINGNLYVTGSYGRNEQRIKSLDNNSDIDILIVIKKFSDLIETQNKMKNIDVNGEEVSFIFCLKNRLENNSTGNYVLSTDFENPIYETFQISINKTTFNVNNRINSQFQGTAYLVGKYVIERKIVDLYKSLLDAVKTILILDNSCLFEKFIKMEELNNYAEEIEKYIDYSIVKDIVNSIKNNKAYNINTEQLLEKIKYLIMVILDKLDSKNIEITLNSINYFLINDLIEIQKHDVKDYLELKNLVHYENLGLAFSNTIELKEQYSYIKTLGPSGTDSQKAAIYWKSKHQIKCPIILLDNYTDVFSDLKNNEIIVMPMGFSDRRVDAEYKSWVDFHFKYIDKLEIMDYFKLETQTMVLIENKKWNIDSAIIHSSVYQLFLTYFNNGDYPIEFEDSKVKSFEKFKEYKYRYTLISEDYIQEHYTNNINVLKRFNPIMMWIVYRVKENSNGK